MAVEADFSVVKFSDSILTINLIPAVPIGGWSLRFEAQHRPGGISGLITKSSASGFGGSNHPSGITITNSGNGQFNVYIDGVNTSGLDYGAYAYSVQRMDSGSRTLISEGFMSVLPDGRV